MIRSSNKRSVSAGTDIYNQNDAETRMLIRFFWFVGIVAVLSIIAKIAAIITTALRKTWFRASSFIGYFFRS